MKNLSAIENGIYYESLKDNTGLVYNIVVCLEIIGELSIEKFWSAFDKTVSNNPSFRKSYYQVNGEILSKVHEYIAYEKKYIVSKNTSYDDLLRDNVRQLDLASPPLFNTTLISTEKNKHLFLLNIHHIIFDGFSVNILIDNLLDYYSDILPTINSLQYEDFIKAEAKYLASAEYKSDSLSYDAFYESNYETLDLPTDNKRKTSVDNSGSTCFFDITESLAEQLTSQARKNNTSLYCVLLAAYHIFLAQYSRNENVVSGVSLSGRDKNELESIIGMFVSTMPVRSKALADKTISDFISDISKNMDFLKTHQKYRLNNLLSDFNIKTEPIRNPVFDTTFNLVRVEEKTKNNITIRLCNKTSITSAFAACAYDLGFQIIRHVGQQNILRIFIEYKTSLFKEETIHRIWNNYLTILEEICSNENKFIKDISIVSDNEIELIRNVFNNTYRQISYDKTVIDLIDAQAELTPSSYPKFVKIVYF